MKDLGWYLQPFAIERTYTESQLDILRQDNSPEAWVTRGRPDFKAYENSRHFRFYVEFKAPNENLTVNGREFASQMDNYENTLFFFYLVNKRKYVVAWLKDVRRAITQLHHIRENNTDEDKAILHQHVSEVPIIPTVPKENRSNKDFYYININKLKIVDEWVNKLTSG